MALSAVQTSGESFADNDTSIMTSAAIDDRILTSPTLNSNTNIGSGGIINFGSNKISISGDAIEKKDSGNFLIKGEDIFIQNEAGSKTIIRGVSTVSYLSGAILYYNNSEVLRTIAGGTQLTGSLTLDSVAISAVQTSSESFADNNTSIMTSAAIDDRINAAILTKDNTDEITEGSSNLYFTNERVDDRVNSLLTAGSNITLTYDDAGNALTIAATQLTNEQVQDVIGGMLGGDETGGVAVTYDDANNHIDFAIKYSK